ncbi:hypothetical protein NC652_007034 [Populus alba x Populus x berolinensis]|nr:hypothetical protein NC652_007034 [Populus alba x Populus x berolinensis]
MQNIKNQQSYTLRTSNLSYKKLQHIKTASKKLNGALSYKKFDMNCHTHTLFFHSHLQIRIIIKKRSEKK